ncbi:hypothetical protein LUZ60_001353 [Juncus effusus]|nr:hypothetical protein LUZ60_001353 [Juncus effusus]
MGSLPSLSPAKFGVSDLSRLFQSQLDHLTNFFHKLDLVQAFSFTQTLLNAPGKIFFSGVGKSGIVADKWAKTLASLGLAESLFLCPLNALHGDLGLLSPKDILVLLSKSGASQELMNLVPCAKSKGAYVVAVTSAEDGKGGLLGKLCDMNMHLPLSGEICPFGLAPLTSSGIQIVFGDTIVAALMEANQLSKEQYAMNHPAGKIGKSLIFKVKDVMKKENELPLCKEGDLIMSQLTELSSKGCGCLLVTDESNRLIGTFTDGDLRRTLTASGPNAIINLTVGQMCNRNPRTITADAMAVDAMKKMEAAPSPVQFLPVVDDDNVVIGIVTLHGLVSAGL